MRVLKKLLASCMLFGLFTVNVLAEDPPLIINGESITGTTDRIDSEGWKYDKGTSTLTLKEFEGEHIYSNVDLNVILEGSNKITGPVDDDKAMLDVEGDLNIEGSGSLSVNGDAYGIDYGIAASGNLTINKTTVTAGADIIGIFATKNITVNDSTVEVGAGFGAAMASFGTEPIKVIGEITNGGIPKSAIDEDGLVYQTIRIWDRSYPSSLVRISPVVLSIDGEEYVESKKTDHWEYNKEARTLILDNYDGGEIESTYSLTVILKGENIISSSSYAGLYLAGDSTIEGSGSLDVTGGLFGIVGDNLTIKDTTVTSKADGRGILYLENCSISNSTVEAEGGDAAIGTDKPIIEDGKSTGFGKLKIDGKIVEGGELEKYEIPDLPGEVWEVIRTPEGMSKYVKIVPAQKPKPVPTPEPSLNPAGRTCQDDGYPAGYQWSDAAQACVLVAPSSTSSTGRFAVVNTADK